MNETSPGKGEGTEKEAAYATCGGRRQEAGGSRGGCEHEKTGMQKAREEWQRVWPHRLA